MSLSRVVAVTGVLVAGLAIALAAQTARPWPPGLQPMPDNTAPRSPAEEMDTFFLAPGYRVELVASEPMVQDPIALDWDLEGRLWVVEMPGYMPDLEATTEKAPTGRIVVLEDEDDDGRMDRRTVFADGFVLARALKVLDHGVLVGEPPSVWLLGDTNGDLRADTREEVTNRYGRRDANVEHNANGLFWALDNGIHTSEVDIALRYRGNDPAATGASGASSLFEVQRTLSRGQWGITQDDAGRLYRNTNESVLHVDAIATRYFTRHPTLLRTRGSYESLAGPNREVNRVWPVRPTKGVNRGYQSGVLKPDGSLANFTAVAAPTIYRGDRLPAEVYGNVFVVEPAGNLVSRIVLEDGPSSIVARKAYEGAEFLASTDERFRPVYLSSAPDGTLYLADLYRGIIQHKGYITEYLHQHILQGQLAAPTGYGRIYRIVHETTQRGRRPSLTKAPATELVGLLSHPNGWYRDTAQRLLVERNANGVAPELRRLAENTAADWRARLHALWTLDGIGRLEPATVVRALADPRRDIRLSALRLAERWLAAPHAQVERAVLARMDDTDWNVRQQLAATLGELRPQARVPALSEVLGRYGADPVVMDVALSGLRGLETATIDRLMTSTAETPTRAAALTMLAATVVRAGQDVGVQRVFDQIADARRPLWQRSALLRGAEVSLRGAAMPGNAAGRRGGAPPAPTAAATAPGAAGRPTAAGAAAALDATQAAGARGGPGGARAFPGALEENTPPPATPLQRALLALSPPVGRGRGAAGGGTGLGAPLRVSREPAIAALAAAHVAASTPAPQGGATDPRVADLSARIADVLTRVEWPGKPGAAVALAPLSAGEQRRFEAGREIYASLCATCHQTDGRGRAEVAPALVGSLLALGPADITARVLINGREGSVGLMPPLGAALSDDQVAAVLTYVRREWGQTGTPVDPAVVTGARQASSGRTRPWNDDDLTALVRSRLPPSEAVR